MSSTVTAASLMQYYSGVKLSDREGKTLPASAGQPMTPEVKAELARRAAYVSNVAAELAAERAQRPELDEISQANSWTLTNVTELSDDQIPGRISYITDLIQSGEAEKYSFFSGNGDEQTTSIHQYLYWLQLRAKDIESDGTYTPDMFK
ncbi:hypothetical protein [Rhizobium sp. RU36D]|uniref:hypothetical protein n=1 Tax=Rhizobium sp. RU36D TaxID=1907415 RepID=UPI0009D8D8F3|nr:hypothetical protein [Rhizobium sp. RU36D]SMC84456.1 hypothetical protein SAMN05880593_1087 [Rhizobium sp. RU36D]